MRAENAAAERAEWQLVSAPEFPSEAHFKKLKAKGPEGRAVNRDDLWSWHAYDYGWRRIILQTRDDKSPIDPNREWFDARLAAEAEIFYSRKFNRRPPDIGPR